MGVTGSTGWLQRLRERGVIRVAASYAVIAWLLLQIADVTFEPLGVPRWVMVSLIVTAILGFPVAVALAWFYEAGDRGITLDTAAEGVARPVTHGLRRYADILIIGVLLAAVAVLLVRQSNLGGSGASHPAIAVLPFRNLTTSSNGEVLASGIAESVLHQLANLSQLDVIARTSSFAFGDRKTDAREIGRQLGARYLLEGSVQSDRDRMRVTTQLIDTETGADVWSMRFDQAPGDIFEIQDEIAVQVTRALELSLAPDAMERMTGQGTENLEAYLAFLQGRALLATTRVADASKAIAHFEESVSLDPGFAAGYLGIAEAALFVAEYEVTDDRQSRFERARRRGETLVAKALTIDPANGDAYLQRAYLAAFEDLTTAETDYRRGLELSPNSAEGHAGLAAVLYATPARRDEALELLDRARKLDPLEPAYDVTKAVFLYDERSDVEGARELLDDVVARNPRYVPALARLCETNQLVGDTANAVQYCEEALRLDPLLEDTRRFLILLYLQLGDPEVAEMLVEDTGDELTLRALPILLERRDWHRAGDVAYESLERRTASPFTRWFVCSAIRMHARATGDYRRAEAVLEGESGVRWDASGNAALPEEASRVRDAAIALADVLLVSGQEQKGRKLLAAILDRMRHEVGELRRPEYWYFIFHPAALAMNGEDDAALAMLERAVARKSNVFVTWQLFEIEPAFAELRRHPRFQAVRAKVRTQNAGQRRELERLRAEGLVPDRSESARDDGQG
jgi:TolB-like protein